MKKLIYVLMFVLLIQFVYADNPVITHDGDLQSGGNENQYAGFTFIMKDNVYKFMNVTVDNDFTCNSCLCMLYNYSGSDLSLLDYGFINTNNNDTAKFSGLIQLAPYKKYGVACGRKTTVYVRASNESLGALPDNRPELTWNNSFLTNSNTTRTGSEYSVWYFNIISIGLSNDTSPPSYPMNITINTPKNGTGYNVENIEGNNSKIWINGTFNTSSLTVCGINDTDFTSNGANLAMGFNFTFLNNTAIDGFKSVYVYCNLSGTSNNTATVSFAVDFITPTINSGLETNDTIILLNNNDNLTGIFTFSDAFLYYIKINDSISGTMAYVTNLETTTYQYNLSHNVSNHTLGLNYITVTAADGHTANNIKDYKHSTNFINKKLKFEFKDSPGFVSVKPTGFNLLDDMETTKQYDRYTFKYSSFINNKNKQTFIVESDHKIQIVKNQNKGYNGWLVIPDINKWIDFNLKGATGKEKYKFNRISDYEVEVEISGLDGRNEFEFESIGDLNVVTKKYEWYLVNATTTAESLTLENSTTSYTLNITKGGSVVSTQAGFFYNGILYPVTKSSTTHSDLYSISKSNLRLNNDMTKTVYYNWTFNVTTSNNYSQAKINDSIGIYKMIVGNCNDTLNETAINFSVKDSSTAVAISGFDFEGSFTIWDDSNPSFTKAYGFTNTSINYKKEICMFPWFATLKTSYDTLFSHPNYDDTHYIIDSGTIDSSMETVNVFLVNSSVATGVTISLVDEVGNELNGYVIEAWRYDLGDSDYTLITTQYTDSEGRAKFYLDVTTYEYRFNVKNSEGVTVHVEPKQKLIQTAYTFVVTLGTTVELVPLKLYSLNIDLISDKTDKNFTVIWSDISWAAQGIKLIVQSYNSTNGSSTLSTQTSTADSGTLAYHITTDTRNKTMSFLAAVYANSTDTGEWVYVTSDTLTYQRNAEVFGLVESLLIAFFLVGTLLFLAIAISAEAAIVLGVVALLLSFFAGLIVVSGASLTSIVICFIILLVKMKRRLR